jgi:MFS family permease
VLLGGDSLVLACLAAAGVVGNPLAGALSDRVGARRTLLGGLVTLAGGAGGFALVRAPAQAFAAAGLLGVGAAVVWPAQDALLASLAGPERLPGAFSLRHATLNVGLGAGSVLGALIADTSAPASFQLLFGLQAGAALGFAALARRLPDSSDRRGGAASERVRSSYREILADRPFRWLLPLVTLLFAAGYAQYQAAFPAYATGPGGLGAGALGAAFAANTFTVVAVQLVALRLVAGRRRSRALALVGGCWAAAWLVALIAGRLGGGLPAATVFVCAMVVFGVGETMLSPTLPALVNDLAREGARGRYNGAYALACTGGFVLGPAVTGAVLAAGRAGALLAGLASACALAAVAALALERRLPPRANHPTAARLADRPA